MTQSNAHWCKSIENHKNHSSLWFPSKHYNILYHILSTEIISIHIIIRSMYCTHLWHTFHVSIQWIFFFMVRFGFFLLLLYTPSHPAENNIHNISSAPTARRHVKRTHPLKICASNWNNPKWLDIWIQCTKIHSKL